MPMHKAMGVCVSKRERKRERNEKKGYLGKRPNDRIILSLQHCVLCSNPIFEVCSHFALAYIQTQQPLGQLTALKVKVFRFVLHRCVVDSKKKVDVIILSSRMEMSERWKIFAHPYFGCQAIGRKSWPWLIMALVSVKYPFLFFKISFFDYFECSWNGFETEINEMKWKDFPL